MVTMMEKRMGVMFFSTALEKNFHAGKTIVKATWRRKNRGFMKQMSRNMFKFVQEQVRIYHSGEPSGIKMPPVHFILHKVGRLLNSHLKVPVLLLKLTETAKFHLRIEEPKSAQKRIKWYQKRKETISAQRTFETPIFDTINT